MKFTCINCTSQLIFSKLTYLGSFAVFIYFSVLLRLYGIKFFKDVFLRNIKALFSSKINGRYIQMVLGISIFVSFFVSYTLILNIPVEKSFQ